MPSPMPTDLARERGEVLHRALRSLPVELLEPLLRGIRKHADSLVPGALYSRKGGCAVGMMLHELRGGRLRRFRRGSPTIHEEAPEIATKHPRLAHLEFIFDRTCEELAERLGVSVCEAAPTVGLWMAGEVAAEINLRHMEALAENGPPTDSIVIDEERFAEAVSRIRELRPWLSEKQAETMVEAFMGARRVENLAVPPEWEAEVELQRERVAEPA